MISFIHQKFNKVALIAEVLFFIIFGLEYSAVFLDTTLISSIVRLTQYEYLVFWFGIILAIIALIFDYKGILNRILGFAVLTAAVLFKPYGQNNMRVAYILILVAAAGGKSFRLIAKVALWLGIFWMAITFYYCFKGAVPDLIREEGRHAFGMIYYLELGTHFLYLMFLAAYLYFEKYSKLLLTLFTVITGFSIFMIGSRVDCAIMIVFVLILFIRYLFIKGHISSRVIHICSKTDTVIKWIGVLCFDIITVIMIGFSYLYSELNEEQQALLTKLSNGRFFFCNQALTECPPKLWGQVLPAQSGGNGGIQFAQSTGNSPWSGEILHINVKFWIVILVISAIISVVLIVKFRKFWLNFILISGLSFLFFKIINAMDRVTYNILYRWQIESDEVTEGVSWFVDISFVKILLEYGIIIFLVMLFLLTFSMFRLAKVKEWLLFAIMILIAIQCCSEHHIMDISYNVFFLLPFADLGKGKRFYPWQKLSSEVVSVVSLTSDTTILTSGKFADPAGHVYVCLGREDERVLERFYNACTKEGISVSKVHFLPDRFDNNENVSVDKAEKMLKGILLHFPKRSTVRLLLNGNESSQNREKFKLAAKNLYNEGFIGRLYIK